MTPVRQLRRSSVGLTQLGLAVACALPLWVQPRVGDSRPLLPPEPQKDFVARLPAFDQAALSNGLRVYSYTDDSLPLVALSLSSRIGAAAEPAEKAGLARLAFLLLVETINDPGNEHSTAALGNALTVDFEPDGAVLSLQVMSPYAEAAVASLGSVLQSAAASVDPGRLNRLKSQLIASQSLRRAWAESAGEDLLRRVLFSPQHPYGHAPLGTPQTLAKITPADVASFYRCVLSPASLALSATGRVSGAQVMAWAQRYLAPLRPEAGEAAACERAVPTVSSSPRTEIWAIGRPGLVQTWLFLGRVMPGLDQPPKGLIAQRLAETHVLSRSFHRLRVKKSLTYSVSSMRISGRYGSYYLMSTPVESSQTGKALSEIFSELFAVQRDPVNGRLVIFARVGEGFSLMARYSTLHNASRRASQLFLSGLPLSWDHGQLQALPTVGAQDVDDAGYQYFDRNRMQIVAVGDPEIIEQQLGKQSLGKLHWLPPEPPPEADAK